MTINAIITLFALSLFIFLSSCASTLNNQNEYSRIDNDPERAWTAHEDIGYRIEP